MHQTRYDLSWRRSQALIAAAVMTLLAGLNAARADELQPIPFKQLRLLHSYTPSLAHVSLDGAPAVPTEGVVVTLTCVIEVDSLSNCVPEGQMTDVQKSFVSTALKRIRAVRVGPTTNADVPVSGRRTTLEIHIGPTDKFPDSKIDFSNGDLILYDQKPTIADINRFYPRIAVSANVEALVDLACMVNSDHSLGCADGRGNLLGEPDPDDTNALKAAFADAAHHVLAQYHVSPLLQSGQSSTGTGVRHKIRFKLE